MSDRNINRTSILKNMVSKPLVLDCLVNNSFYVKSMVDTGCLCFAVFDEGLVRKHKLRRI